MLELSVESMHPKAVQWRHLFNLSSVRVARVGRSNLFRERCKFKLVLCPLMLVARGLQ